MPYFVTVSIVCLAAHVSQMEKFPFSYPRLSQVKMHLVIVVCIHVRNR